MYNEILTSLYRAFVFGTYVDSLFIASHTHSFLIAYPVLACSGSDAHLRPLYLKFDNRIKINFFVSIIEYQKNSQFNIPSRDS